MKPVQQLQAELNAATVHNDEHYSEVSTPVVKALRKTVDIKAAIANFEFKVQVAVAEFEQELSSIEQNYKQ